MKKTLLISLLLFCCFQALCQEYDPAKSWSLKEVVEYAIANSVNVKTKEVTAENNKIALQTSQYSRLPSLNGSIGESLNFGRSQNREGVTVDKSSYNTTVNANAIVPVFEGFRINQQIKADKFNLEASLLDTEQARQDLSLKVVGYFLQVLYSNEALKIAREQVEINRKLVDDTKTMVDGGKKSISELYNAESSLAKSESVMVEAENSCHTTMLDLVQAINYPDYRGFRLDIPDADSFLAEAYLCTTPVDSIYDIYLQRRPAILAAEQRVKMAERNVKVAEAKFWPSIQLGVNYGTGFFSYVDKSTVVSSFFDQLGLNSQVAIGATLSIPIFNRMATYNSVRTAKNKVTLQSLTLKQSKLDAIKEVQTAYVNASTALGKYEAGIKSVDAAQKSFDFEQKKFDAGRSTAYQFDEMRQKYAEASLQLLQAKYTFIFKAKILEFYKGNPLY